MTQQKAASLTSNLFARKGRASPANLLIAELEGVTPEEAAIRIASVGRRRAKAPTPAPELPLLAFVDAQVSADSAAAPDGTLAEDTAAETAGGGDVESRTEAILAAMTAGELRPAASLLARGAQALKRTNGHASAPLDGPGRTANVGPAAAAPPFGQVEPIEPDVVGPEVVESNGAIACEAETVSGDGNVAAIEDVPLESTAATTAAVVAEVTDVAVTETLDVVPSETAAAEEESAILPGPPPAVAEVPSAATDAERPMPTAVREAEGVVVISASAALRRAATRQTSRPAAEPVSAPPPPAARNPLPWRSAAVLALGVVLGLGAYVAFSGKPPSPPAEIAAVTETTVPETAAMPAASTDAAATATPQAEVSVLATEATSGAAVPDAMPEPSFDIIRIDSNGQSIIAGRAAPFSEWILLNNDRPIASIQADANGEWVILPDASVVPGANAFSLVPKNEHGKVAIPAPAGASDQPATPGGAEAPLAPRSEAGADNPDVALPRLKPETAAQATLPVPSFQVSPDGAYEVQVASVRQSADAERERRRLAAAFPTLLGALDLRVQEASVDGAGIFFRVRSGGIGDLGVAREVCRQLTAEGQGCLVVRRPSVEAGPQTEVVQQRELPSRAPAPQQAERP